MKYLRSSYVPFLGLVSWAVAQVLPGSHFGIAGKNATFDYVVVGGGTAGLAVAYRLAEDGTNTVAVIEAGGFYEVENGNISTVPAYDIAFGDTTPGNAKNMPLVDWGFVTTPQAGVNNRTLHYHRGKTLGGSSAENAMIYNRGTVGSYQSWANLVNDSSWTLEQLLPYFANGVKLTEVNPQNTTRVANSSNIPSPASPGAVNTTGGPLQMSYPNYANPFSSWAQLSFRELGFPDQQDFISGSLLGSQFCPLTIDPLSQERGSSEKAFLQPLLQTRRTNLQVFTHTLAKQIMFSADKTATGVKVTTAGTTYYLSAKSEVILSAGAFQSPQLLMVSGIGPAEQLTARNISVLVDLPGVGQNMQDHLVFGPLHQVNIQELTLLPSTFNDRAVDEYITNRTGPLTTSGCEYLAWEKIPSAFRTNFTTSTEADLARFPADWPEVEYEVIPANLGVGSPYSANVLLAAVLVAPLSRGNITISSDDMADAPIINPNWLTSETDQQVAIQAFRRARAVFETQVIQKILIGQELAPGANITSDAEILEYIKSTAFQNWHASCTCIMGKPDDPMAVVDSKARVFGVSKLRIVDASSFALLPPGHPMATVYLMAEKIAADIIKDARLAD